LDFPVGNIVTGIATVIAVVVANKLSSNQSGKAKFWDLRRQAYGVILSELAAVARISTTIEARLEGDIQGYFDSDARVYHENDTAKHMGVVRQRFSDDYLIISTEFLALFEACIADLELESPNDDFLDETERFVSVIKKYHPILLAQGRKEIAAQQDFTSSLGSQRWVQITKRAIAFMQEKFR
jgi:hypothetical protein